MALQTRACPGQRRVQVSTYLKSKDLFVAQIRAYFRSGRFLVDGRFSSVGGDTVRAAHPSDVYFSACARYGASAGCSAIKEQSFDGRFTSVGGPLLVLGEADPGMMQYGMAGMCP